MSEMIDRVEMALFESYDSLSENPYPAMARAAIEAMRHPTQEMIEVSDLAPNDINGRVKSALSGANFGYHGLDSDIEQILFLFEEAGLQITT